MDFNQGCSGASSVQTQNDDVLVDYPFSERSSFTCEVNVKLRQQWFFVRFFKIHCTGCLEIQSSAAAFLVQYPRLLSYADLTPPRFYGVRQFWL